ncbi:MAG: hypothetical protein ABIH42_08320 [Planctomycetota bacterium]
MVARFIFILCVFLAVGMLTIWQQGRATHAGYEIARLERVKESLDERNKRLQIEADRLKLPYNLFKRIDELKLELHPACPNELIPCENIKQEPNQQNRTIINDGEKIPNVTNQQNAERNERGESCRSHE